MVSKVSQLDQVLRTERFTQSSQGDATPCDNAALLKKLLLLQRSPDTATDALEHAIIESGKLPLEQYHANVLYFCDQLFQLCQLKAEITPALMENFMLLRPVAAAVMIENGLPAFLTHPLCHLLDRLWYASLYWTPLLGKPGDKYKARIEDFLHRIHITNPARAPYAQWLSELNEQLAKEFQRAELLSSRISESERGSWIRKQAHQIIQHNVNRTLLYDDMPEAVEKLLKGPWRESLHQVLIAHGIESQQWHNLLRLAEYLLDSVQIPTSDKEKKSVYKLIPKIPGMLKKQLGSISDASEMQEWVSSIEALHMKILMGETLDVRAAEPLPIVFANAVVSANVSSALMDHIATIQEGQWLVYHNERDEPLLCRLSIKLEDAGQLLFVNVFGAKCLQKSYAEFAYLLSSRHVYLLNTDNNFTQSVNDTITQFMLMNRFHNLLQADEAERRKREIVRVTNEAERRRRAQEKARQEAERLARLRQEEIKRAKMKKMEDALLDAKEKTLRDAETLAVGAWLELDIAGKRQKCKLAAILSTTGKLILTNREGIKLAEIRQEDLTQKIIDGSAIIIENGHRFENSLEKMIHTLRKT